jgi:hypothetical protein
MPPFESVLNSYSKNIHGSAVVKDAFYKKSKNAVKIISARKGGKSC